MRDNWSDEYIQSLEDRIATALKYLHDWPATSAENRILLASRALTQDASTE